MTVKLLLYNIVLLERFRFIQPGKIYEMKGGLVVLQKIVVFKLNEQQYGVDVNEVQSIEHVTNFTDIPQVERYFKGIIHLRGEIIPIIDLKLKLNMDKTNIRSMTKIIVSSVDDVTVGFLVDEATEVLDVNIDQLDEPTELTGEKEYVIQGVVKLKDELILLMKFHDILDENDLQIIRELVKSKQ